MGQYYIAIILGEKGLPRERVRGWSNPHRWNTGAKLMEHSYLANAFVESFEYLIGPNGLAHKSRVVWAGDYADKERQRLAAPSAACVAHTPVPAGQGTSASVERPAVPAVDHANDGSLAAPASTTTAAAAELEGCAGALHPDAGEGHEGDGDLGEEHEAVDFPARNMYHMVEEGTRLPTSRRSTDQYRYLVNHDTLQYVDKRRGSFIHPLPLLTAEGNGRGGGDYYGRDKHMVGRWARHVLSVETDPPAGDFTELVVQFC
jgi:hypothetical protein